MKELINPYKGSKTTSRLNVEVDTKDFMTLKSISPAHGTIQTIVSLYVRTIILELEDAGIHHYDPDNYERFVCLIQRYTHPRLVGKDGKSDESKGKTRVHKSLPDVAHLAADAKSKSGKGKQQRGKTKE